MIYAILHDVRTYCARSSFPPLLENLDCRVVPYHATWEAVQSRSWTAGHALRRWGMNHYGSEWNWLVPYAHEWLLARATQAAGRGDVIHFLMAEFASPRHPRWFNRHGARLVGTFHCSARRLEQVLGRYRCLSAFDRISVMSASQVPFFVARGYPADRIQVTLHGVDSDYFHPGTQPREPRSDGALRLLLVGSTERDHAFAARVMRQVQAEPFHLEVLTSPVNRQAYEGLPNVTCLSGLNDAQLVEVYRRADLLFMPVLDCTANNAVMESMSCGTPVMANRAGGIPEYVKADCNYLFDRKDVDEWVTALRRLNGNRVELLARRAAVRAWAESLDWRVVKSQYLELYDAVLAHGRSAVGERR